jgi:predicted amidophosphoribosyltransferase
MMADGTTICIVCHKRVPAESGLCQICGTILEVRVLANQPDIYILQDGMHLILQSTPALSESIPLTAPPAPMYYYDYSSAA